MKKPIVPTNMTTGNGIFIQYIVSRSDWDSFSRLDRFRLKFLFKFVFPRSRIVIED